jgi:hypothetical protein
MPICSRPSLVCAVLLAASNSVSAQQQHLRQLTDYHQREKAERIRHFDANDLKTQPQQNIIYTSSAMDAAADLFKTIVQDHPGATTEELNGAQSNMDAQLVAEKEFFDTLWAKRDGALYMSVAAPSDSPSSSPTVSPVPSSSGTSASDSPSDAPSASGPTDAAPTASPSAAPSISSAPTASPITPVFPSVSPTVSPITPVFPSVSPTAGPTVSPTVALPCGISEEDRAAGIEANILEALGPDTEGADLFLDISTPQGQATDWLINEDEFVICPDDKKLIQRWVLAVVYFSTNGDEWFQCGAVNLTDGCGAQDPFSGEERFLSPVGECEWAGISCLDDECITELEFEENNLIGT